MARCRAEINISIFRFFGVGGQYHLDLHQYQSACFENGYTGLKSIQITH